MVKKEYRLTFQRTKSEWDYILSIIPEGDLNRFLNKEIVKLVKKFDESPSEVTCASGDKSSKTYRPHPDTYDGLESISKRMKKPIASIVDELIISPILQR